ncbi:hypothetical protein T265_07665 [Opisthorchis viverrini]|uniref:Uncharacterized protein n=1 Tax=Opisthorchis viverrini TaxID=6198 RepID=A0A074ZBV4_OPIVI|nr:hypothetical protein T265_07665 [Opisthorchis viverrini]KER24781.1 hypothetical protein T265_07665 [Opisthorchis viverrini]
MTPYLIKLNEFENRFSSQLTVTFQHPSEVAAEVVDLIDPLPALNPYNTLEAAIIRRKTTSDGANIQKLLSEVDLGYHMQGLACSKSFMYYIYIYNCIKSPTEKRREKEWVRGPSAGLCQAY